MRLNEIDEEFLEENAEIIEFGRQQGRLLLTGLVIAAAMAALLGVFWPGVLFLAAFVPLRSYAGGYHADTQRACNIQSLLIVLAVYLGLRFAAVPRLLLALAAGLSLFVIVLWAPVENSNKRLDALEKKVYGKRTRIAAALECAAFLALLAAGSRILAQSVCSAFLVTAALLAAGKRKYRGLAAETEDG